MPDINDVQQAMRGWQIAFAAMSDYFETNDIFDPVHFDRWLELIAAQDVAQSELKRLVDLLRVG